MFSGLIEDVRRLLQASVKPLVKAQETDKLTPPTKSETERYSGMASMALKSS